MLFNKLDTRCQSQTIKFPVENTGKIRNGKEGDERLRISFTGKRWNETVLAGVEIMVHFTHSRNKNLKD